MRLDSRVHCRLEVNHRSQSSACEKERAVGEICMRWYTVCLGSNDVTLSERFLLHSHQGETALTS